MQIIGHRGARREAPENTLGGFRHINALGLKAVEFDVRLLKDHRLAVLHDATLERTAGQPDLLSTLSTTDLDRFDNRQGWPEWPSLEPIPTLEQVLALMTEFTHIEVEVKAVEDMAAVRAVTQQLIHELAAWPNHAAVTITSFDVRILAQLYKQRQAGLHHLKTGLLLEPASAVPQDVVELEGLSPLRPVELAQALDCSRIGLSDKLTNQEAVFAIQAANLPLSIWTVNDPDRAKQLAAWGIEGLITDVPTLMLKEQVGTV